MVAANNLQQVRIGVVAGRSVGTAVQRNLAKRRLRACIDQWLPSLKGGCDMVFLARKPMDQASYAEICNAVQVLLKRSGVVND